MMDTRKFKDVDEYIKNAPLDAQKMLRETRKAIKESAPKAEEMISYFMPAYKLNNKPLVYFAGYKKHIGFYPTPNGISQFKKELAKYKKGKGTAQFQLNQKLPVGLIKKIVKFRVKQISALTKKK